MLSKGNKRLLDLLDYSQERSRINWRTAGGGTRGVLFIIAALIVTLIFANLDLYFLMMFSMLAGVLLYNVDIDIWQFVCRLFKTAIGSGHITENGTKLIAFNNTMDNVEKNYYQDELSAISEIDSVVNSNPISTHLIYESKEDFETIENTFENIIYNDTHEVYSFFIFVMDSLASIAPLVGLIGTVYGIVGVLGAMESGINESAVTSGMAVAMKTTLYGAIFSAMFKVISMRLKIKRDAFDYDFERCRNHLQFIVNKRKV